MAVNWCQGRVKSKQVWADGLFTLHVDVEGVTPFEPGQFLQLGVRIEDEMVNRPYSIASPFGKTLEFYIVKVDDGKLTPLLEKMEPGAEIEISDRAAGSFTLQKTPASKHLWLIATGTGLAPYVAMLRTTEPWERYEKVVLVHGVRIASDLSYQEEFATHEKLHGEKFVYIPTLTREESNGTLRGRIPELMRNGTLEKAAGDKINAENSVVMLCGNPAMLDDVESLLGERNMKKHRSKSPGHIVLERYW